MSKKDPMQVIAAAFHYEDGATLALEVLEQAKLHKALGDKAVLSADYHGKITIKETGDMGGGKGAVIGGALGVIVPGIGSIVGAAGGALIGGLAAKLHDAGFPNDQLKALGDKLTPNTSLLLAVVAQRARRRGSRQAALDQRQCHHRGLDAGRRRSTVGQ